MTALIVGPSVYSKGGTVVILQYANGGTALQVVDDQREPQYTATVNIPDAPLPPDCVWLKGWSENEGVPQALKAAGVVELLGASHPCGFARAIMARLTPAALAMVAA